MRRRRRRVEETSSHERWLVSYADFMTLLFALFVVLFASSYHDKRTLQQVSAAVQDGFKDLQVFSNGRTAVRGSHPNAEDKNEINSSLQTETQSPLVPSGGGINLLELEKKLNAVLGKEIQRNEVALRMTPEGFIISLHELGFFNSGDAHLLPGAAEKVRRIATVLMQEGMDMRVEGHSDNVPIHNAQYNSNWELSTGRAMAVAMMLVNDGSFDPQRLSVAGYGQYHPVASNDTPEGRRANRRVDIVVVPNGKPLFPSSR